MKKVLTLALVGMFSATMVGCSVDVDDDADSSRSYKRTEVKSTDDGMRRTETEVKRETSY